MKTTTLKLDESNIYDLLELIDWGLTDYPDVGDERYLRIVKLANRLEKAKCRLHGIKWDKSMKWE